MGTDRHLAFPLRLDRQGRTALADDDEHLRGLVEQLLFTSPGERVNRPDFGCGLRELVFAPSGDELAGATSALVSAALQRWLGELLRVEDVVVRAQDAVLHVTVTYSRLDSGEQRQLQVSRAV